MSVDLTSVMILLALQFAAFGWRVAREIDGSERHPFPFVPVPDNVNVLAMLGVLYFCIVAPFTATGLRVYPVGVMAKATFAAACVLLIAHPLVVASHYRVWGGRSAVADAPLPYCTRQEAVVQVLAIAGAAAAFLWVLQAANVPLVTLTSG